MSANATESNVTETNATEANAAAPAAPAAPSRPRRGPMGGHGHGPMMPGEKAKDFKGTLRKMLAFMGRFKVLLVVVFAFAIGSTIFNIVGPKVLSEATTELFNGIVAKIDGSGGIDYDRVAQILVFTVGAVRAVGGVLLRAGLDHELRVAAHLLPAAAGHRGEDRPHAVRLLRAHVHGRHALRASPTTWTRSAKA